MLGLMYGVQRITSLVGVAFTFSNPEIPKL